MHLRATLTGLFIVILVAGCGTEKNAYRLPLDAGGEERLEKRFKGKSVKVVLDDGQAFSASKVRVHGDSVSYLEHGTDSAAAMHIDRLARLETRNRSKGVSRGIGYGFLIGAAWGIGFGLAVSEYTFLSRDAPAPVLQSAFAFGVAGGIVGLFTGAIAGVREVYTFTEAEQSHSNGSSEKEQTDGNDTDAD